MPSNGCAASSPAGIEQRPCAEHTCSGGRKYRWRAEPWLLAVVAQRVGRDRKGGKERLGEVKRVTSEGAFRISRGKKDEPQAEAGAAALSRSFGREALFFRVCVFESVESSDEDDEDLYGGMSPPKTIQFALPPSKLLQTPGKFT